MQHSRAKASKTRAHVHTFARNLRDAAWQIFFAVVGERNDDEFQVIAVKFGLYNHNQAHRAS